MVKKCLPVILCLFCLCCGPAKASGTQSPPGTEASAPAIEAAAEAAAAPSPARDVPETEEPAAEEEKAPAPSLTPWPVAIPQKSDEIRGYYALGRVFGVPPDLPDDHIAAVVRAAHAAWKEKFVQIAWYAADTKSGQGLLAVGEYRGDAAVTIVRPRRPDEALLLERGLCFPTSPEALCRVYLENEVTADDDFRGKDVMFEAAVADIARGAFNRPYAFFPGSQSDVTGLTCYFSGKNPNLRELRKGLTVKVRGTVKGFLAQDVILENCDILAIGEAGDAGGGQKGH
jgi:hypothetical protein